MMPRLLSSFEVSIEQRGILLNGLYYECPSELEKYRAESTCTKVAKIRVFVDPLSTNQVYFCPKDLAAPPIRCELTHFSREHRDLSWAEVKLRDEHVEKLHRLTVDDHTKREDVTEAETQAIIAKQRDELDGIYGSVRHRNSVAGQVSTEAIKDYQASTDNAKFEEFMHGPLAPSNKPAEPPSSSENSTAANQAEDQDPPSIPSMYD